jgi:hypothetical protein
MLIKFQSRLLAFASSFLLAATLAAQDPAPQAASAGSSSAAAEAMLAALPQVVELRRVGDRVEWHSATTTLVVTGVDPASRDPLVVTALGPVRIERRLIEEHRVSSIDTLSTLVAQGQAAHLTGLAFELQDGVLTGPSLRAPDLVITTTGVLRKQPLTDADRSAELAAIANLVRTVVADLPDTGLSDLGQRTIADILGRLSQTDGGQAMDEVFPSTARRLVRHGWLRLWFPAGRGAEAVRAVEDAVAAAEAPRPITTYLGPNLRLDELRDAFGRGGWTYRDPAGVRYLMPEERPEMLGESIGLALVVQLSVHPDAIGIPPFTPADIRSASVVAGHDPLATWTPAGGFQTDLARWTEHVQPAGKNLVHGILPPHIAITDLYGDVVALAVAGGLLRPTTDGSHAAAEQFLNDAAKLLPDAPSLDLIGNYLFTYVYPSPDPRHPELVGNKQTKGNVQQTVWQLCATTAGGLMRGDCADIAELYQTIADRQGRHPIIIGLPAHAACAWAEQHADLWQVFVLQTGPALQFSDHELPEALRKAYTSFDPGMAFDPDQVPLLLRFSGEVSRSSWQLSWRIFQDPAYAQTMIEVQRDWHYQTYQRGIATMRRLIEAGDHDPANYQELSGLATFTGQYALAADYHQQALARTTDSSSQLTMAVEQIDLLVHADHPDQALTLAKDLLDHQYPAQRERLGDAALQVALELAGACLGDRARPDLHAVGARVLTEIVGPILDPEINQLRTWLNGSSFNREAWDNNPRFGSLRHQLETYIGLATTCMRSSKAEHPSDEVINRALTSAIQEWLNGIAFHDFEEDSAVMVRYAAAGNWYAVVFGEAEFDHMLDSASLPTAGKIDHGQRIGGSWQVASDLPWIKASVPYWFGRLAECFSAERKNLDPALILRLSRCLLEAHQATVRIGLDDPSATTMVSLGQEIAAMIAHDSQGLHQALRTVAESQSKELRDDAAQWLGDAARFLDPTWYAQVLQAWRDEVDYKPKYFWIAWRAAVSGAPRQALMAARLAAERFADDQAFSEEYAFMRTLLEPAAASSSHERETNPSPSLR